MRTKNSLLSLQDKFHRQMSKEKCLMWRVFGDWGQARTEGVWTTLRPSLGSCLFMQRVVDKRERKIWNIPLESGRLRMDWGKYNNMPVKK